MGADCSRACNEICDDMVNTTPGEDSAEKESVALDVKIAANATLFENEMDIMSDRAALRQLREAAHSSRGAFNKWTNGSSHYTVLLPQLSVWSREKLFVCDVDAKRLQVAGAQLAAVAELHKSMRQAAKSHYASLSEAYKTCNGALKECEDYIKAEIKAEEVRKANAAAEAAGNGQRSGAGASSLEAAMIKVAKAKAGAQTAVPLALDSAPKQTMAAWVALREGHTVFAEGVGKLLEAPTTMVYAPQDRADLFGNLDFGGSGGSEWYKHTSAQLATAARLVDQVLRTLAVWEESLASPAKRDNDLHGPGAAQALIERLPALLADDATAQMVRGASYATSAHDEHKTAMRASVNSFRSALQALLSALKAAQEDAKGYREAWVRSEALKKKVDAAIAKEGKAEESMKAELATLSASTDTAKAKLEATLQAIRSTEAKDTEGVESTTAEGGREDAQSTSPSSLEEMVTSAEAFVLAVLAYATARPIEAIGAKEPAKYERVTRSADATVREGGLGKSMQGTAINVHVAVADEQKGKKEDADTDTASSPGNSDASGEGKME